MIRGLLSDKVIHPRQIMVHLDRILEIELILKFLMQVIYAADLARYLKR